MFHLYIFKTGRRSDEHDDRGQHETGPDPSAPVTRRGVLTSFLTGKPMDIPEHDVVCTFKFMVVIPLSCPNVGNNYEVDLWCDKIILMCSILCGSTQQTKVFSNYQLCS